MTADPFAPPRRPRRRRLVLAALAMLAVGPVAGGVVVAGNRVAESRETSYQKAWNLWKHSDRDAMEQDGTSLPDGLYHPRNPFSKTARAEQRRACSAVGTAQRELGKRVDRMPTIDAGVLALLHPTLRATAKESDERKGDVERFVKRADKALRQVHADCTWAVRAYADTRHARGESKVKKAYSTFVPRGTTGFGYQCQARRCLPLDPAQRARTLKLFGEGQRLQGAWITTVFSRGCSKTSYGDLCQQVVSDNKRIESSAARCLAGARRDPGSPRTADRCSSLLLEVESSTQRLGELARDAYPQLGSEAGVMARVSVPDVMLYFLAETTLEDLGQSAFPEESSV